MKESIKILLAQIDPKVGAIFENAKKITKIIKDNQNEHDLIVFPELILTGYTPEDLLFRDELYTRCEKALKDIAKEVNKTCMIILGHPQKEKNFTYNAASLLNNGCIIQTYYKQKLPNYNVFDERRYFTPGKSKPCIFTIKGETFGLLICEDLWFDEPLDELLKLNIKNIISINSSPFDYDKPRRREKMLRAHTKKGVSIIYLNQTGAQDDVLFDGQSLGLNADGKIALRASSFKEELLSIAFKDNKIIANVEPKLEKIPLIYEALKTGLKDYVLKNNFKGVVLGISGGIDSALTMAIAVDALGSDKVFGAILPSRYNSSVSEQCALLQLKNMNVKYTKLSIEPTFKVLLDTLKDILSNSKGTTTKENLQARIRLILLMALSNESGNLLLNTSNKSELAIGYSTLYGDLSGGFAVLKDVYKTQVYELARYRNSLDKNPVIPEHVITRPPSAELAPNQKDQDTLPPYDIIDGILRLYVEQNLSANDIIEKGYTKEDVFLILNRIKANEYKRYQAPPGSKISIRAFGKDWRYPLTSGFNI